MMRVNAILAIARITLANVARLLADALDAIARILGDQPPDEQDSDFEANSWAVRREVLPDPGPPEPLVWPNDMPAGLMGDAQPLTEDQRANLETMRDRYAPDRAAKRMGLGELRKGGEGSEQ